MPAESLKSFTAQKLEKVTFLTFAVSNFREEGPALRRSRYGNLKGKPQTCQNATFIIRDLLPSWLVPVGAVAANSHPVEPEQKHLFAFRAFINLKKGSRLRNAAAEGSRFLHGSFGEGAETLVLLMAINFISKPNPCPFTAFLGFPVLCSFPGDRACR